MRSISRITLALVAVALLATTFVTAHAQQAPSITLTPSQGSVGDPIAVEGTGFAGPGTVTMFLSEIGGQVLATTPIADRNGTITPVRFSIPSLNPGSYNVVACVYQSATRECLGPTPNTAGAKLTVVAAPPPTTTTTRATTSTTFPGTTSTTLPGTTTTVVGTPDEGIPTTTSSLVLGATTTTVPGDPGQPPGPTGVAFTTTSTSLDLPTGFVDEHTTHFPDLEITAVEVTQGIQDLQNRMPLVAGKRTVVRVYVAADRDPEDTAPGLAGGNVEEPDEVIGPEGWEPIDGLLHIRRGGQDEIIYPVNAPITAYRRGSDRLNGNETLNFEIPDGWAVGEAEITVLVWSFLPETVITQEPDAGNNFAQGTVTFQEADPPQVIWFRLRTPGGGLTPDQYDNAYATAIQSYITFHPVAVPNFLQIFAKLGPGPIVGSEEPSEEWDFEEDASEPLKRMRFMHAAFGLEDLERVHGLIPSGTATNEGGLTSWNGLSAWSKPTNTTPAHEGAHMYFIKHAPCADDDDNGLPDEVGGGGWGWVDQTYPAGLPSCSIAPEDPVGYYGVSIGPETQLDVYSNNPSDSSVRYPFMGYESDKWVDAYHYCLLMENYGIWCNPGSIGLDPMQAPGAPVDCGPDLSGGIVLDLCLWNDGGDPQQQGGPPGTLQLVLSDQPKVGYLLVDVDLATSTLGHAEMLEATQHNESIFEFITSRAKGGDMNNEHTLRVTDAQGNVLALVPLSSSVSGHSETDDTVDTVEMIPWFTDAAALDLLHNDVVVDSRRPSTPPEVQIEPFPAPDGREFSFSWSGSDPDGDPLLYTPMWSVDGGANWRALDTQVPSTTAFVREDLVLPGGEVMLKVVASDGLQTSSAVFGPFNVPEGLPTGVVVAPETTPQYSAVRMTFSAQDPEGGPIDTGSWASSIDGPLGEGHTMWTRDLSLGVHEISVEVADQAGNVVTITKGIEVVPGSLGPPRLPGDVPMAEQMVLLGPGELDQIDLDTHVETEPEAVVAGDEDATPPIFLWAGVGLVLLLATGLVVRVRRSGAGTEGN